MASAKNQREGREYVELNVCVRGPVVPELNLVFATDWYSETDELLADELQAPPEPYVDSTAGPGGMPGPAKRTRLCHGEQPATVHHADLLRPYSRLSITSPYFVPDESLLYAITTAAQRGVEVELFVSAEADQFMVGHAQCSYYEELLDAGVRIYLYPAPWILHSKHFSVDDEVAVIGSSNMDMRSFALNYEVVMMLVGGDVVARMRAAEDDYRALSQLLTADEWRSPFAVVTVRRQPHAADRCPSMICLPDDLGRLMWASGSGRAIVPDADVLRADTRSGRGQVHRPGSRLGGRRVGPRRHHRPSAGAGGVD